MFSSIIKAFVAGTVLGLLSLYADSISYNFWLGESKFPVSVLNYSIILIGNAAGVWALCALSVSYIVSRKYNRAMAFISTQIFLVSAVASYYFAISILGLRPGAGLVDTAFRWILAAILVAVASFQAGWWLKQSKNVSQVSAATAYMIGMMLLDFAIVFLSSSEYNLGMLGSFSIYFALVTLALYQSIIADRIRVFALTIVYIGVIAVIMIYTASDILIILQNIQHG